MRDPRYSGKSGVSTTAYLSGLIDVSHSTQGQIKTTLETENVYTLDTSSYDLVYVNFLHLISACVGMDILIDLIDYIIFYSYFNII